MKPSVLLLAIGCLLTAVSAQQVEATIYLPENGGLSQPQCGVVNAVGHVFIGGGTGDCVVALNQRTGERVARIPAGTDIRAIVANPEGTRVYAADYADSTVTVIDGWNLTRLATIRVGAGPIALCVDEMTNNVYCANYGDGTVMVIDGASSQVVETLAVMSDPGDLCYNPLDGKVYCANRGGNSVTTIDCGTIEVEHTSRGRERAGGAGLESGLRPALRRLQGRRDGERHQLRDPTSRCRPCPSARTRSTSSAPTTTAFSSSPTQATTRSPATTWTRTCCG